MLAAAFLISSLSTIFKLLVFVFVSFGSFHLSARSVLHLDPRDGLGMNYLRSESDPKKG